MAKVRVRFLVTVASAKGTFLGDREYALPASRAEGFVRDGVAIVVKPVRRSGEGTSQSRKTGGARGWRATMRRGDVYNWQVRPKLPMLAGPYIKPKFDEPGLRRLRRRGPVRRRVYLEEVGGDGAGASPAQAAAIDYLVAHERAVYEAVLRAVGKFSREFRADWVARFGREVGDQIAPRNMTVRQAAERVLITRIAVSEKALGGMAYLEIRGECAWDRGHGFMVVLHRTRVVAVSQQGTGWSDAAAGKRRKAAGAKAIRGRKRV